VDLTFVDGEIQSTKDVFSDDVVICDRTGVEVVDFQQFTHGPSV
jgi:hypothetical protein